MRAVRLLIATLAVAAALRPCGAAPAAREAGRTDRPSIRVTADATVQARPDRAEIDLAVVTQEPTAEAAAAQNAEQMAKVLAALRATPGPAAIIRTAGYSLSPMYRPPREGAAPAIVGYTASNALQVATDDLAGVGRIIDRAMQAGANSIRRIQFTLKDEGAARAQALREAAAKARAQAEVLAAALGLRIVRVLSVTEGGPVRVRPLMGAAAAMAQAMAAPTPVEPGAIDVHAEVEVVVEVAP